ncbi:MAG TPA: PAS domain-containing sensor histidine kinase [Gammaproteobacteria bacterium]|nr:PAS domain-containing sensor histidine kinase [Gammaproteobacteria bacterium]
MKEELRQSFTVSSRLISYLTYLIPFAALLLVAFFAHFMAETQTQTIQVNSEESINVGLAKNALSTDLGNAISDLRFLSTFVGTRGFDTAGTGSPGAQAVLDADIVAQLFATLIAEKALYDQVRFIDNQGWELLRVNDVSGVAERTAEHALQNKANRYYFQETATLGPDQVYISPLDLNVEHGEIEQPLKPMMRFAAPVFDDNGERRGMLVLNYQGRKMLDAFSRAGFRIADRFPLSWQRVRGDDAGQFVTREGAFTFTTIHLAQTRGVAAEHQHGQRVWKIVSRLSASEQPGLSRFVSTHSVLYLILSAAALSIALILSRADLRHRLVEAQRAYEQRFRQTLEHIQMAAVEIDLQGRMRFCNAFFGDMVGVACAQLLNGSFYGCLPEARDQRRLRELLQDFDRADNRSATRDIELYLASRDGVRHLLSCHITPLVDTGNTLNGLTILAEDITSEREAEERVRRLSRVVEQSPSIVLITNNAGEIEYVNPKFCEVTGYTPQEVLGKNPRFLKSGETPTGDYGLLWQRVTAGQEWRGEFHNRRKNGELYWESAVISGLSSTTGDITHFVAVKEDISERKRLQAEVDERNRELARTQALTEMGRVASMIAHDLRNPLSSVKMGLQIIADQPREQQYELSQIALDQVLYMESILEDILNYVRPDALHLEWVNIATLIQRSVVSLQKVFDTTQVQLTLNCDPGLASVPADAHKLRQVFANLILNAVQAVAGLPESERQVVVTAGMYLDASGMAVRVSVWDNGPGMTDAEKTRVFEPFYTTKPTGTGLGLSIVEQIVKQHQGSVIIEDAEQGLTVIVTLPTTNETDLPEVVNEPYSDYR